MRSNQPLRDPPGRDRRRVRPQAELEEPILAELFSVERLEQHAQTLAAAQTVTDTPRRGRAVGPRIAENGRVLLESYRILARAIKDERSITPAAEWLVDNFPIVDEQLREIRDDLPPDYYRELPKLAEGHLAGYPRVLGLAWAYIAHTDSRFDPESLRRMVRAYQEVEPLTIGELWAIAISLRILLVENLRRLAEQIVRSRAARQRADELADGLLGLGPDEPGGRGGGPAPALAGGAPDGGPRPALPAPARPGPGGHPRAPLAGGAPRGPGDDRRGDGPPRAPAPGDDERDGPQRDHEHAPHLVVRLGRVRRERQPGRRGPARAGAPFGEMDFATRDRYRHAIEELARGSGLTEVEVARRGRGDGRRRAVGRRRRTGRGRPTPRSRATT